MASEQEHKPDHLENWKKSEFDTWEGIDGWSEGIQEAVVPTAIKVNTCEILATHKKLKRVWEILPRRFGVPDGIVLKREVVEITVHVINDPVFIKEERFVVWVSWAASNGEPLGREMSGGGDLDWGAFS
ncbi:hypothetical protein ACLOJK_028785 [Asimina triloba]